MINVGQIIAESARERGKERLLRLLQRIQNDKREAIKMRSANCDCATCTCQPED